MDRSGSKVSSLPWVWMIEYLAKNKQVKPFFLHAVMEAAPNIPDDIGKNMREAVSLRCLEELSSSLNGCLDGMSSRDSRAKINSSKSCEDILQCLLHDDSLSEAALSGKELLKWDIHSFTEQKNRSMPRTALEVLKDTIVDGTHPFASSLRDLSGLTQVNIDDRISHGNDVDSEPDTCQPNEIETAHHGTVSCGDSLPEEESHTVKRGLRDPAIDNTVQNLPGIHNSGDSDVNRSKSKRHKQNGSLNMQSEKETPVSSPERLHIPVNREAMNSTFEPIEALNEQKAREECNGNPIEHGCDETIPNGNESHHKAYNDAFVSQPGCEILEGSKDVSAGKVQMREAVVEDAECCTKHSEEISSGSDGYRMEESDVIMKKHEFLKYRCMSDDHPSSMVDWTKQNVCMKCNKGGRLLTCQTINCPLVVHENCVDPLSSFDDDENFFCPFCGYSKSISQYLEAKKKASLARKDLAEFIDMIAKHQLESLYRKEYYYSGNGENVPVNLCQDGHVSDKGGNREMQKNQGQKEQVEPSEQSISASGHNENLEVDGEIAQECGVSGREKELNRINEHFSPIKKVMDKKAVQKGVSGGVLGGQKDQALGNHRDEGANLAHDNLDSVVRNQNVDGIDGGQEVLPCTKNKNAAVLSEKPTNPNSYGAGTSEDEDNESNICNYRISFRT